MGCGESKSDAVDTGEVRLVEARARVDAELERIEQEGQAKTKEAQELVEAKIERIKQSDSAWTIESFALQVSAFLPWQYQFLGSTSSFLSST